jgi:hypothetical protein
MISYDELRVLLENAKLVDMARFKNMEFFAEFDCFQIVLTLSNTTYSGIFLVYFKDGDDLVNLGRPGEWSVMGDWDSLFDKSLSKFKAKVDNAVGAKRTTTERLALIEAKRQDAMFKRAKEIVDGG